MSFINLRKETLTVLHDHGLDWSDVRWAGNRAFQINLDDLWEAMDINYDRGYGSQEIAHDLIIVGDDWWMERHEYDGAEWWEFKEYPVKPKEERYAGNLKIYKRYGGSLLECNRGWE